MIKLIALDLDGTLLDDQKRLSYKNEMVLKECIRRGIHIVPCTGRIWSGVPDVLKEMEGIRYAITVNGAVILDRQEDKVLDERKLDNTVALDILQMARGFRAMYDAYMDGQGISEARFMDHLEDYGISREIETMIRDTRIVVPDIIEWVKECGHSVEKVNYFFADQEERERARQALLARADVTISSSLSNNLEINALGANKGEGICRLAAKLGLKQEETMGIGDGENDITMMQMAGIGVAMGNAEETVKAAADYVTLTNSEDGVAAAIEKLVFG